MANMDPLTKVYNRRYFQFYLTKEIERNRREGTGLSLLFIDIDDFKKINDEHGHVAGDEVLIMITGIINDSIRSSDLVFRYGGDEFIVLLPRTSIRKADILKERIVNKLAKDQEIDKCHVSVSIGQYEAKGENYEELLHFVDQEMYMQKLYKNERKVMDVAENIQEELSGTDNSSAE